MPKFDYSWNAMKDRIAARDEKYDKLIEEAEESGDEEEAQRLRDAKADEWRPSGIDDNQAAFRAMFD